MSFNPYLKEQILNHFFRGDPYTPPAAVYMSLHTNDPGDNGVFELTAPSYSRKLVSFGPPDNGVIRNDNVVFWEANENWGEIDAVVIWDSPSGGNPLVTILLNPPVNIQNGDRLEFLPGKVSIGIAGFESETGPIEPFSVALRNLILDRIFRNGSFTPTTIYASLHYGDPGDSGANEASGGSYARQPVTFTPASRYLDTYEIYNSSDISFSLPAGTYTHIGLWNASTGGTLYCKADLYVYDPLWGIPVYEPVNAEDGDTLVFTANGGIRISI